MGIKWTNEKVEAKVAKAVKAETKRCIAAVKEAVAAVVQGADKTFARGARNAAAATIACIKAAPDDDNV